MKTKNNTKEQASKAAKTTKNAKQQKQQAAIAAKAKEVSEAAAAKAKQQASTAKDAMEKQVAKAEREAKAKQHAEERLAKAKERLAALKQGKATIGLANQSLSEVHTNRANAATLQGLIDATNALIKEVASTSVSKDIIKVLKASAAEVILANVGEDSLALYIDNKGCYKAEAAYRLAASKSRNPQVKAVLDNLRKAAK